MMATRTLRLFSPMPVLPSVPRPLPSRGFAKCRSALTCRRLLDAVLSFSLLFLFFRDQLVEPADLPLAVLQAESMQFAGVAVDLLTRPRHRGTKSFSSFLHPAPATFEDPHPDLGGRAG